MDRANSVDSAGKPLAKLEHVIHWRTRSMNGLAHCVTRVLILHAAIPTRAGSGCFALAIVGVGNEGQQLVARLRPTQGKSVPSVQFPMIFCEPIPTLERSINHLEDRDIADIAHAAYPEGEIALAAGAHPDDAGIHGFGSCISIKDGWYELSRMGNYGPSTRDGRTATTHRSSRSAARPPMDFATRDFRSSDIRD